MSRFQEGDRIRHRTGVDGYEVTKGPVEGNYTVLSDVCTVAATLACNYVDENFILVERHIGDEIQTEDISHALKLQQEFITRMALDTSRCVLFRMQRGAGKRSAMEKVAASARSYGTDMYASEKTDRRVKAAPPFKIDPNAAVPEDVAVTLEGIPQGYYLKAFRPAGPADLIIKTNGVICKESDHFVKKKSLIRTIVAEIPPAMPHVPGIPAGYDLVRVGTPHPGNLFIDAIGGVSECMKPSETSYRAIVRKKVSLTPCTGVLPGIPLGYKVVRFGDVSPEEFYFDTVGNLKQGPSKHRLVVQKREVPLAFSGHAEIPRTSVDWGVVDRKVRNDAADAAAYAHMQQCGSRIYRAKTENVDVTDVDPTVQFEREFVNIKSLASVWTTEPDMKLQGTFFTPTGRSRKVKVI